MGWPVQLFTMVRLVACAPLAALGLSLGLAMAPVSPAQAGPLLRGGVGGPNSGAGVLPGAGYGQAGPGLVNPAPVTPVVPAAPVVRPAAGGVGGPASGAGVLPGAGAGRAGLGL